MSGHDMQAADSQDLVEGEGAACLPEKFKIVTQDGVELGASGFTPDGEALNKIVVIAGTVATPRYFYATMGCFLSTQGFPALIFDYRGIGESAPADLRESRSSLADWGQKDLPAVLDWVHEQFPDYQIMVIGHGIGGQLPALAANNHLINGMISISTANHYREYYRGVRGRRRTYVVTQIVMPAMVKRLGYAPTTRLRFRADLPADVFLEWSRWCQSSDYLFDDPSLNAGEIAANLRCPLLATMIADDVWAPEAAVKAFHQHYINANTAYWPVKPADYHADKFGHFGPIAGAGRSQLWSDFAQWLAAI